MAVQVGKWKWATEQNSSPRRAKMVRPACSDVGMASFVRMCLNIVVVKASSLLVPNIAIFPSISLVFSFFNSHFSIYLCSSCVSKVGSQGCSAFSRRHAKVLTNSQKFDEDRSSGSIGWRLSFVIFFLRSISIQTIPILIAQWNVFFLVAFISGFLPLQSEIVAH